MISIQEMELRGQESRAERQTNHLMVVAADLSFTLAPATAQSDGFR